MTYTKLSKDVYTFSKKGIYPLLPIHSDFNGQVGSAYFNVISARPVVDDMCVCQILKTFATVEQAIAWQDKFISKGRMPAESVDVFIERSETVKDKN